jgi:hypothetical protein
MKPQPSLLAKLVKIYDTFKTWIIYLDLFFILVLLYFGSFLGSVRDILLPAAIVSALAIFFDTLKSLDTAVQAAFNLREFLTVIEAAPILSEIVSKDKDKTIVDIIASTGGTTLSSVLPTIAQSSPASSIEISLHLINPSSAFNKWFPQHWPQEAQMIIERVKTEISSRRFRVYVYTYDSLPVLHGIMINKTHLLLGFFGWKHFSGRSQLSGAERPHRYFIRKEPGAEYFFELFEDWLENSPCQIVYTFPEAKP